MQITPARKVCGLACLERDFRRGDRRPGSGGWGQSVLYPGRQVKIGSLRRFKDDVSEVKSGMECGITIENFPDVKQGDVIEAFVTERVATEVFA